MQWKCTYCAYADGRIAGLVNALAARLKIALQQGESWSFSKWMDACLYGPGGYYQATRSKTGAEAEADFATSPTLHPFFARAVAKEIVAHWHEIGTPTHYVVQEWGGGEGDLARDALNAIDESAPDLAKVITWRHAEISTDHRAKQVGDSRITWGEGRCQFGVGNEFLDALPFDVAEYRDGWKEARVNSNFVLEYHEAPTAWLASLPNEARHGQRIAIMQRAWDWLESAACDRILLADYGSPRCWQRDLRGTIRTFRHHQHAGSPLQEPGSKDITASIDWLQLHAVANWQAITDESQEEFLLRHGALEAMNAQERDTFEGARSYLRLRQLVLPTGLGRAFRVAVLNRNTDRAA